MFDLISNFLVNTLPGEYKTYKLRLNLDLFFSLNHITSQFSTLTFTNSKKSYPSELGGKIKSITNYPIDLNSLVLTPIKCVNF